MSSHWVMIAVTVTAERGMSQMLNNIHVWFLQCLLCYLLHISPWIKGTDSGLACVPNTGSLADNSVLLDSFKLSQLTCQDNPCRNGHWPWLSVDGYYRCLAAATIKNCPRDKTVVVAKGKLECQEIQPDFSNIAGEKCPRRKIFRNGRCQFRFFG